MSYLGKQLHTVRLHAVAPLSYGFVISSAFVRRTDMSSPAEPVLDPPEQHTHENQHHKEDYDDECDCNVSFDHFLFVLFLLFCFFVFVFVFFLVLCDVMFYFKVAPRPLIQLRGG